MHSPINQRSLLLAALISSTAVFPRISDATVVEFQTVMGNFEVNLYDNATPATVTNFLDYLNNGAYTSWGPTTPAVMMRTFSGHFRVPDGRFRAQAV